MEFQVLDDPLKFYNLMLNDISRAKSSIYLETYKFLPQAQILRESEIWGNNSENNRISFHDVVHHERRR